MNNDVHINLRLPKALYEVLEQNSVKLLGKGKLSSYVRLVLSKHVNEVCYENNKINIDRKL